MADRLGIAFDQKINNRLRGVSRMESLEIILEGFDGTFTQEEKESLAQEKNDAYRELLKTMSPQDRITILYGHNMKNDTMFGSLHDYEKPPFLRSTPMYTFICRNGRFCIRYLRQ